MTKLKQNKTIGILLVCTLLIILITTLLYKNWQSKFEAPRQNTKPIEFTIKKETTLEAIIGNLSYYGFIKDKDAFTYAIKSTMDSTSGRQNSIKIGNNTIDRESRFIISQSMNAWQIADTLLNKGEYSPCNNGCSESIFNPELLPGGDLAPTLKEKYSWVKTYEDCTKSIGHDGGQLSSEQYAQRTGIRKCVSPDGREFTKGKEGWSDIPTP